MRTNNLHIIPAIEQQDREQHDPRSRAGLYLSVIQMIES